jgi:DNA-binding transcriptional ArsR family regulator
MSISEDHQTTTRAIPGVRELLTPAANMFKLVSDPTRLAILHALRDGDRSVTQLKEDIGATSQPQISHHLTMLRLSGLVEPHRVGKNNKYSLARTGQALVEVAADLRVD